MSVHEPTPQCKHLLGNLSEYIDGELQAELCAELEQHLQGCEDCRVVVDTLRKTIELYRQTSASTGLPGSVRERLFFRLQLEDYLQKGNKQPNP